MEINQPAINFELPDLQGNIHHLCDYRGKIVMINFWSAECPHSARTDGLIMHLRDEWNGEVEWLSVASNQNESVRLLEAAANARGVPTVLIDEEHVIADQYEAITTPHIFVLDREGILRYRGAVDDVTFRRRVASQFFLREAVESLLQGKFPPVAETPSYGCTIVREI